MHFFGKETLENYLFPIRMLGADFVAQSEMEYLLFFEEDQLTGVTRAEQRVDRSDLVVAIESRFDDDPDSGALVKL